MGSEKKKKSSEAANYSGDDPSDSCALKKSVISILDVRVDSLLSRRRGGKKTGTDLVDADSKFSGKTAYLSGGYERLRGGEKCNFSRSNWSLLFFFNYLVLRSVPQRCERGGAGTPAPPQGRSGSH